VALGFAAGLQWARVRFSWRKAVFEFLLAPG